MNNNNSIEEQLGRQILILANAIINTRNSHLQKLSLTAGQADSLHFFILNHDVTITDLKQHLQITHQTASGIVQRMASKGLLELKKSDKDARYQVVTPTDSGIKLEKEIINNRVRTGGILLKGMNEDEKKQFLHLLDIALKNIKNYEEK